MKPFPRFRSCYRTPALLLAAVLLLALIPAPGTATSPSSVSLSYGQVSSDLSVTIDHPVLNIKNHYIREVQLTVNGKVVNDSTYTSQPSDTFTYTYPLALSPGNVVVATATCSLSGSGTGTFIMPGPTADARDRSDKPAAPTQKASTAIITLVAGPGIILAIRRRG